MNNETTMIFRNGKNLDLEEKEKEKTVIANFMKAVSGEVKSWQDITSVKIAVNGEHDFPISNLEGKRLEKILYYGKTSEPKQNSMVFDWCEGYMVEHSTPVKYVYKDPVLGVVFIITNSGSCYINLTYDIWGQNIPNVLIAAATEEASFEPDSNIRLSCISKSNAPFHVMYQRTLQMSVIMEDGITLPGMNKPCILYANNGLVFLL